MQIISAKDISFHRHTHTHAAHTHTTRASHTTLTGEREKKHPQYIFPLLKFGIRDYYYIRNDFAFLLMIEHNFFSRSKWKDGSWTLSAREKKRCTKSVCVRVYENFRRMHTKKHENDNDNNCHILLDLSKNSMNKYHKCV